VSAQDIRSQQNLLTRLDRTPITRSVVGTMLLLMVAWLVESFDVGIVGTVVLSLKEVLRLNPSDVGILAISSTTGIAVGLPFSGRLADRFGRRAVLIWGVALFGLATLLGAAFLNFEAIILFRFIGGLGEGAVFPLPYLILAEIVSSKRRATTIGYENGVLAFGYLFPSLVGGWALAAYAPDVSWRIPFLIGGVIPLLLLRPLFLWLPESPRYLLKQGRVDEVRQFVEKLESESGLAHDEDLIDPDTLTILRHSASESKYEKMSLLTKPPYLKRGIVAGLAYTSTYFLWYTNLSYSPTILKGEGFSPSAAIYIVGVGIFIGGIGGIVQGHLSDRFGRKPLYAVYIVGSIAGALLVGLHFSFAVLVLGLFFVGWFGAGIFPVAKIYLTEQYPTRIRGLGTSILEFFGRTIPGVGFVYFVPRLLQAYGATAVWVIVAILTGLFFIPMVIWGRETAGLTMEASGSDNAEAPLTEAVALPERPTAEGV